jgi:hypothetical protein
VSLKIFYNSFRLKGNFVYTLIIDVLFIIITAFIFNSLSTYISNKAAALTGGRDAGALHNFIISQPEAQLQLFGDQLSSFVTQFVGILILLPIITFLLYSASRSILWHFLLNKEFKFKQHWKWNLLNLIILLLFVAWAIIFLIVKIMLAFFLTTASTSVLDAVNGIQILIFLTPFLAFLFITYAKFTNTRKVLHSIGASFKTIKTKFKCFAAASLLPFGVILILQLIQIPFHEQYFIYPQLSLYINAAIFLIWLAWFRIYTIQQINDSL